MKLTIIDAHYFASEHRPKASHQMSEFGEYLRALRKLRGISQRDLAAQVGISWTYVCKIEKGQNEPPSENVLQGMANVLDVDANCLINLAGKVPGQLKNVLKDNPTAVELVRVLSEQKLSEDTYHEMLRLALESRASA